MTGKGSGRRPRKVSLAEEAARWEAAFGSSKAENHDLDPETQKVRYKQGPDGKMVPDYMWAQFGMEDKIHTTHFIQRDTTVEYQSPISGDWISGRRAHRYDLHSNGARVYEGRESETVEANNHIEHQEKKLSDALDKSLPETLNDIKYGNNAPPELDQNGNAKVSWKF